MDTKKIEREIKLTLDLLEDAPPLKCDPYFKTRVNQRIKAYEKKQNGGFFQQIFADYLQPVVLAVMLCVNIYAGVLFYQAQGINTTGELALLQSVSVEDDLLNDYSLTSYQYDNFIN